MLSILYVCIGNTCRSPFAQYITQHLFGDSLNSQSAGIDVKDSSKSASEYTIKVMREVFEINISDHKPSSLNNITPYNFDFVIAMDSQVFNYLLNKYPELHIENWNIDDPYKKEYSAYLDTAEQILNRIDDFELKNLGKVEKS